MGWEMIPPESMSGFHYTETTGCSSCKQLESRIKVLEAALKEWKDERCEDPTRIEVVPTEYRAEWKLYDCGKCRACKARAALEVKP